MNGLNKLPPLTLPLVLIALMERAVMVVTTVASKMTIIPSTMINKHLLTVSSLKHQIRKKN